MQEAAQCPHPHPPSPSERQTPPLANFVFGCEQGVSSAEHLQSRKRFRWAHQTLRKTVQGHLRRRTAECVKSEDARPCPQECNPHLNHSRQPLSVVLKVPRLVPWPSRAMQHQRRVASACACLAPRLRPQHEASRLRPARGSSGKGGAKKTRQIVGSARSCGVRGH